MSVHDRKDFITAQRNFLHNSNIFGLPDEAVSVIKTIFRELHSLHTLHCRTARFHLLLEMDSPINHFTKQSSTPRSISESSTQLFSLFSPTIRLGSITHEFLFQQLGDCLAYYNFLSLQNSSSPNTTVTPPHTNP